MSFIDFDDDPFYLVFTYFHVYERFYEVPVVFVAWIALSLLRHAHTQRWMLVNIYYLEHILIQH